MTDITPIIFQYRECCRHLWNSYFLNIHWKEDIFDMLDHFNEATALIFRTAVLRQHFERMDIQPTQARYFNEIKVEPNYAPLGYEAMWADTTRGYSQWKGIMITSTGNDFRFMEFFDWSAEKTMERQYAMVKLISSDEYPELVHKDFLLEAWNLTFKKVE